MKSSNSRIIRGANVSGVVLCSEKGAVDQLEATKSEADNLKALEVFWHNKGLQEGQAKGFDEGFKEGEAVGQQKGLQEGREEGRKDGVEAGKQEGFEESHEKARGDVLEVVELLKNTVAEVEAEKAELLEKLKPEVLKFAVAFCEQWLRRELTDPKTFQSMLEEALNTMRSEAREDDVLVSLASEDHTMLEDKFEGLKVEFGDFKNLRFVPDHNVGRGNCLIETSKHLLNGDLKRQMDDALNYVTEAHT